MAVPSFASRFRGAASTSGSKRLLFVGLGVGLLAIGVVWMSSGGLSVAPSSVGVSNLPQRTVQGQKPVTPYYNEQLAKQDQDRVKDASDTGRSAMPTIRVSENVMAGLPTEPAAPAPDLSKLPRPQPPQIVMPPVALPPPPAAITPVTMKVDPVQQEQSLGNLRSHMSALDRPSYVAASVTYFSRGGAAAAAVNGAEREAQSATGSAPSSGSIGGIPLPLAGSIVYAELIGEANSDAQGPVLAQILQGPLSGARLIGSFGAQRDTLILKFSTLSLGTSADGDEVQKTVGINAVGVDSTNVGTGIATDVDHHFLVNVGLTAAAAFAQGFGSAVAQSGSSVTQGAYGYTVTNATRSLSQNLRIAGATAGAGGAQAMLQAYGNRPTTIKIAAGTPIGILFLPNGNIGN